MPIEMPSWLNSFSTYANGSVTRGKCRVRISDIFAEIDLVPSITDRWVKVNTKIPLIRNAV
jgi:hypothetical protein